MKTVSIRRQGGAAIMTLPPEILKSLHATVGSQISLEVQNGTLIAKAVNQPARKRYTLLELLKNATPDAIAQLNSETEFARDGEPVGRELI